MVYWNAVLVTNSFEALQEASDRDELEVTLGVHAAISKFEKLGSSQWT